ncbi:MULTISPECIES: aspartate kinase [Clostridia]|uniref:amino acid kinase family protein n=1 Tax=Clostridia TaxID=186801 RepID=UPI000EA05B3A|nr:MULTISPECIES: aspartate kinase [Clostridia]NBJ69346.1 aspartate kinase [Roseburia sp. 1XD42-34]RKI79013.1 aspartate kinase [Clostridium sp. 1xD42-85]
MKKIKVLKFGGNSLRTISDRKNIVKTISKERDNGFNLIIVVSAIGRLGDPYATDTLLRHIKHNVLSPRETAQITSCGEIISSIVLSSHLNSLGIKASALTGARAGIKTSNDYLNARIISIDKKNIDNLINEGDIPIVAGFQGENSYGETTLLSRGGSDVTGAAISQTFDACQLDIYTDVPGIMTTDPKITKSAKTLKYLNYDQALKIATSGGKVIHPEAIRWAKENNIVIKIKSLYNTQETTITENSNYDQTRGSIICLTTNSMDDKKGKITIIGDRLNKNRDIHSYILYDDLNIQSFSFLHDKIELILPKHNVNNWIKVFHENFME